MEKRSLDILLGTHFLFSGIKRVIRVSKDMSMEDCSFLELKIGNCEIKFKIYKIVTSSGQV